ncbi:MAG: hypothetical protein FWF59_15755 [Turicibacter sp.]|nr:hypothetical protein [Turicibacter sp.]
MARISDIMTCAIANMLMDGERVFHGVASHLPMVATQLAKTGHAPRLTHLNIAGAVDFCMTPKAVYSSASDSLFQSASSTFDLGEVFDLSMRGGLDVAFLSGVQFDAQGRVNASVIGDYHKPKVRLPGGAGSAVLIPTAKKCILWRTKHDKRTFVDKLDFVTTGGNVYKIVTPLCIFENKGGQLFLDSIHPTSSLEEVQENTGFKLLYDEIKWTPLPTMEELALLRKIDPKDLRSLEFINI